MESAVLDSALYSRQLTWADAQRFADQKVLALVPQPSGVAQVVLEVRSVAEAAAAPGMHQFVMAFRGPLEALLAQGTYQLRHPELGDFAVFLTPNARKPEGYDYEACFAHAV